MLERKCIVDYQDIETILKPAVLANLHKPTNQKRKDRITVEIAGEFVNPTSWRYRLFLLKSTECVHCGLKGTIWALERHIAKKTGKISERYHINLYGITPDGEVMLTKDHITPRSLGGKDTLHNFQTLCHTCNAIKGNKLEV